MTHRELGDRMTVAEFTEWVAFYRHEHKEQEKAAKAARSRRR